MENIKQIANPQQDQARWFKAIIPIAILFVMVIIILVNQPWSKNNITTADQLTSHKEFLAQHGMQVRLIGVSGGGGLVDLRLKMIDAEKARLFLQNPTSFPVLLVAENGTQILAADSMDEDIEWKDGSILFIMLPNSEGLIKTGSSVSVKFGDLMLEPIPAQ